MFGVQFYPTPPALTDKMLRKVDFSDVHFILEPSAGKGDIAQAIKNRVQGKGLYQLDCVEIDSDLQAVLRERGFTVAGCDFTKFSSFTRYDLIAMNPPFANGDTHLLRALELMEHGGQIVCLLNATTITYADSPVRRDLALRLKSYGADIEIIPNAFRDAERRANVDVALVYVKIPKAEEADVFENLREAFDLGSDIPDGESNMLAENDVFVSLVRQYEFESKLGLKIIDDFRKMQKYIPTEKGSRETRLLTIEVNNREENEKLSMQNQYIRELRYKYWATLFGLKQMQGLLTREIRAGYQAQLEKFRAYDFTMSNILQVKIDLSKSLMQNVDDAIMKMFDALTYEHSMGKNTNIHYYNGWKTNKACKVNAKVIVPFWNLYDSRWGGSWRVYEAEGYLEELEKVFNYLDSGRTDGMTCGEIISDVFRTSSTSYAGEKIGCKFFDVSFKKKGTVHVWFTNPDLLKRFNVFCGSKKAWLPESYGKAQYADMDQQERSVIDSFEGKSEYGNTMKCPQYFIGGADMLALTAGGEEIA